MAEKVLGCVEAGDALAGPPYGLHPIPTWRQGSTHHSGLGGELIRLNALELVSARYGSNLLSEHVGSGNFHDCREDMATSTTHLSRMTDETLPKPCKAFTWITVSSRPTSTSMNRTISPTCPSEMNCGVFHVVSMGRAAHSGEYVVPMLSLAEDDVAVPSVRWSREEGPAGGKHFLRREKMVCGSQVFE